MEHAIDALIHTAGTDSVSKILALDDLTEDLTGNGWNTDLAGIVREYIARQRELVTVTSALTNWRIETVAPQSTTALKSMTIEKLMKLKSDVEATLAQKVTEERRALEQALSKLSDHTGGKKARGGSRGAVAPKYRNPETGETWAGRGLKPRWLTAAMKSGKSLESFAITAGKGTRGRPRKTAK